MNLHKQPGCWLRSSHSFKECVIAHWSSEVARKITGAKLYTEIADCGMFKNVYERLLFVEDEFIYIFKCTTVVEEHSVVG